MHTVAHRRAEWAVPAENLTKAGQFTVRRPCPGSTFVAEFSVRVTDKLGEALSENPTYDEIVTAFASATNDIETTVLCDRVDYINDGDHSEKSSSDKSTSTPSF